MDLSHLSPRVAEAQTIVARRCAAIMGAPDDTQRVEPIYESLEAVLRRILNGYLADEDVDCLASRALGIAAMNALVMIQQEPELAAGTIAALCAQNLIMGVLVERARAREAVPS